MFLEFQEDFWHDLTFQIDDLESQTTSFFPAQLGVSDEKTREKLLSELQKIIESGPEIDIRAVNSNHKTLFDIVKQTSYDQVISQ